VAPVVALVRAPARLPAGLLTGPLPLSVDIRWEGLTKLAWEAGHGSVQEFAERLRLDFVPAPDAAVDNRYAGLAVIDFGTSATAIALRSRHRRDARAMMDPAQAAVLTDRLHGLLTAVPTGVGEREWIDYLADVPKGVAERLGEGTEQPLATIADRLAKDRGTATDLLHAVQAELEALVYRSSRAPQRILVRRLYEAYRDAYATPPLQTHGLRAVRFNDPAETEEIYSLPSTVHVRRLHPISIELRVANEPPAGTAVSIRGAKGTISTLTSPDSLATLRELRARPDLAPDAQRTTTADLIGAVYRSLTDRAQRAIDTGPAGEVRAALRRVIITYPTVTPPVTREALKRLVSEALDGMNTQGSDFDEGVAAALYFIMLEIGRVTELGIEAIRGRSRRLPGPPDAPRRWRRNILVIDIGGGTTDIVLVSLLLTELPTNADQNPLVGRRYLLEPEVLGATGHAQLGGDYLTLRVFYWIKACIADEILRRKAAATAPAGGETDGRDGSGPGLAEQVLAGGVRAPVPADVRKVLDEIVPTRGADRAAYFTRLWNRAEEAKQWLGSRGRDRNGLPYELRNAHEFVDLPDEYQRYRGTEDVQLLLDPADFRRLAVPVVDRAAQIAAGLVAAAFRNEVDPHLDQVALSGRTTAMPLVRSAVGARLADLRLKDGVPLAWNPDALVVETVFAKEVASMGAAFGATVAELGARFDDQRRDVAGGSRVEIRTGRLRMSLPCDFALLRIGEEKETVLRAGDSFVLGAAGAPGTVRSAWIGLSPQTNLYRPLDPEEDIQWAQFHYVEQAQQEGYDATADPRWAGGASHSGPRVYLQIEVDQGLSPTVNLCLGKPHWLVEGDGLAVNDALDSHGALIAPIYATPDPDRLDQGVPVFPAGSRTGASGGGAAGDGASPFPETFARIDGRAGQPATFGGLLSSVPLPERLGGAEGWTFFQRTDDGRDVPLGPPVARPAGRPEHGATWLASLDSAGRLRVHLGRPPYWEARTFADVLAYPGTVLSRPMMPVLPERNPEWDPFTGEH